MARPIAEDFGRAFRRAYQDAGLTQTDLAERLQQRGWAKVTQSQISKWVRGISVPPIDVLPDVDDACGRPRGYVLRVAGYVADNTVDVRAAIMAEERLSEPARLILLDVYESALKRATAAATPSNAAATALVASDR